MLKKIDKIDKNVSAMRINSPPVIKSMGNTATYEDEYVK